MRILRVAQKLYPEVPGGGTYHVHAMSRDQAAMGHDVTVLTVATDPELPHVEERDGYTVVRYPSTLSLIGNDISAGLARHLATVDDSAYDVCHAHSHLYFSTNLAALKGRLGDLPLAITNHGLYSQNAPEWVFDAYLRTLGRWTFNRADVVFCYTDTDRNRVRELGVTSPIKIVSNGIDTGRFHPQGSQSDMIDHNGPVILFVGRLVEGKRPTDAIRALAAVRETHPSAALFMCGQGPLRPDLESLAAELGIAGAVTFLGQVSYDAMPGVYRGADVFVLPSRAEGVPRTVMEAMATEVPVVCSNLPQIRELVSSGGYTVDVGDHAAFAERIAACLDGSFPNRGRERIVREHSWTDTVDRTTDILEKLAAT
ncbi:glycosyltransferase family 4 protein [Haloplanus natans]|uniref:glycosyltransferase family 4 protein n=1 Tax=Haloplanus natans TaxID=376171 RepID=UPI000677BB69|nr:glycosyltransferase family 4 protein [Haloplanus natans]